MEAVFLCNAHFYARGGRFNFAGQWVGLARPRHHQSESAVRPVLGSLLGSGRGRGTRRWRRRQSKEKGQDGEQAHETIEAEQEPASFFNGIGQEPATVGGSFEGAGYEVLRLLR